MSKRIWIFSIVAAFFGCVPAEVVVEDSVVVENVTYVTEVPILMYHYVREVERNSDYLGWNLSVAPALFEEQMKWLYDNGWESVGFEEILGGRVPEKSVVLTFDDGFEDFYTNALPILDKYGFDSYVGIITERIGWEGYMDLEQLWDCVMRNVVFISHSITHPNLTVLSDEELRRQLYESKEFLEDEFDYGITGIVYPSGKYDEGVVEAAGEAEYEIGLTTEERWADLEKDDLMALPRVRVDNRDGMERFIQKLTK